MKEINRKKEPHYTYPLFTMISITSFIAYSTHATNHDNTTFPRIGNKNYHNTSHMPPFIHQSWDGITRGNILASTDNQWVIDSSIYRNLTG